MKEIDTLYQSVDVHDMFARVVRTYDLLNHLFSFNVDRIWRARVVRMAELPPQGRVADVATGTADLAIAFARAHADCTASASSLFTEMRFLFRWRAAASTSRPLRSGCAISPILPQACARWSAWYGRAAG